MPARSGPLPRKGDRISAAHRTGRHIQSRSPAQGGRHDCRRGPRHRPLCAPLPARTLPQSGPRTRRATHTHLPPLYARPRLRQTPRTRHTPRRHRLERRALHRRVRSHESGPLRGRTGPLGPPRQALPPPHCRRQDDRRARPHAQHHRPPRPRGHTLPPRRRQPRLHRARRAPPSAAGATPRATKSSSPTSRTTAPCASGAPQPSSSTWANPVASTTPPTTPTRAGGIHFNLSNNLWGTNFSMWNEGSLTYRFTIEWLPGK